MYRKNVPVSTLARFVADPAAFSRPQTRAMEKAAAHGIRWHELLGRTRPGSAAGRVLAVTCLLAVLATVAVWLLLS